MKKLKLLLLAFLLVPNMAQAQSASDVVAQPVAPRAAVIEQAPQYSLGSFAVVNVKRIVNESKAAKAADKEVKKLQKKYIKAAEEKEKQLKKREDQLQKQQKALSQEAFIKKVEEFKGRIQDDRKDVLKKRKILEASYVSALELIKKETLKVVAKIAFERGIDIVVPTSQILYFKQGVDISEEVLKKLNAALPKVKINVSKGKATKG